MIPHRIAWIAALLLASVAAADGPLRVRSDSLGPDGAIPSGPIEVRGETGPSSHGVLVLEAPAPEGRVFAIRGRVQTRDLEGTGYLEMWTHFPDGRRYFSRTLADSGPLAKLEGTSDRAFLLPFQSGPEAPAPTRLVVNVVLPGPGRVVISDLRFEPRADLGAATGVWWSDPTGGLIGGVLGSLIGGAGAAFGILTGLGRARRAALGLAGAVLAVGAVCLVAGAVALALGQPFAVFYPLLLCGGIALPLALVGGRMARQRYQAAEPSRMRATDLG